MYAIAIHYYCVDFISVSYVRKHTDFRELVF